MPVNEIHVLTMPEESTTATDLGPEEAFAP